MTNMSATIAPSRAPGSSVKEPSNYAVIRLKASDNLISLFQLLIQNGYTQVSFVNSLNQTIFPFVERSEKSTQTVQIFDPLAALAGATSSLLDVQNYEKSAAALTNAALLLDKSAQSLGIDFLPAQALAHLLPWTNLPSSVSQSTTGFLGLPTMPSLFSNHIQTSSLANNSTSSSNVFSQQQKLLTESILGTYNVSHSVKDGLNNVTVLQSGMSSKRKYDALSQQTDQHVFKKHYSQPSLSSVSQPCLLDGNVTSAAPVTTPSAVVSATNTQLRQRGQRGYADDPSLYVTCRLCKNRIMGSRVSNLTNHVRRHSSLKQFQCCYCEYTHNEMAKVRLHMLHNHKDKDSQPIDNLSPEMQSSWEFLMKECFPDHHHCSGGGSSSASSGNGGPLSNGHSALVGANRSSNKAWKVDEVSMVVRRGDRHQAQSALAHDVLIESPESINTTSDPKDTNLDSNASDYALATAQNSPGETPQIIQQSDTLALAPGALLYQSGFPCLECSEVVHSKDLLFHVYTRHLSCVPVFFCSVCGLGDSDHEKLKRHVANEHCDAATADAQVLTRDIDYIIEHYLPQFFSLGGSVTSASSSSNPRRSPPSSDCSDGSHDRDNCHKRENYGSSSDVRRDDDDDDVNNNAEAYGGVVNGRRLKRDAAADDDVVVKVESSGVGDETRDDDDDDDIVVSGGHAVLHSAQRQDVVDGVELMNDDKVAGDASPPSDGGGVESPEAETANAYDAAACDVQHRCPKCRYASNSRRRIVNHMNLRHNN